MQCNILVFAFVSMIIPTLIAMQDVPPYIEVTLRNWDNQKFSNVNIYSVHESSERENFLENVKQNLVAQMLPGSHQINKQLDVEKINPKTIRLIAANNPNGCLELIFTRGLISANPYFQVMCLARYLTKNYGSSDNIFYTKVNWDSQNPPSYISFEIDGTFSFGNLQYSKVVLAHEMFYKAKLK